MNREEHLKFCKVCTNKTVSFEKGITCFLTGEQAAFEISCPNYVENESLKKDYDYKKGKTTKNDKSAAIIILIASLLVFFVVPIILKKFEITFVKPIIVNILSLVLFIIGINSLLKYKNISTQKLLNMKKVIFGIIGAILGLPLSYYFQPDMVQVKVGGIGGYIKDFTEVLEAKDLISNVIMGVIVFALIGFIIGFLMDKNANQKTD